MPINKVLVANRGEIAVRIMQTAGFLGIATVAVAPADDINGGHIVKADEHSELAGSGPAAYLDAGQMVKVALAHGCDAVHPGYGFLSESADFAEQCEAANLIFLGPTPAVLRTFGDKVAARAAAHALGVPLLPGTQGGTTLDEAYAFFDSLGTDAQVMIKALAGGGGRGIAPVTARSDIAAAFERCGSEALKAFGDGSLYVEKLMTSARHIEVQLIGDGHGDVAHLWDRDCSVQRRRQKVVEIAPAAHLPRELRTQLLDHAVALGMSVSYRGLATVEFLVQGDEITFLEVNPRIQVEHTVTEEITGIDLVEAQFHIAAGRTLTELGLEQSEITEPRSTAMQLRVTTDSVAADGHVVPSTGTLTRFQPPSGPGVRVDTHAHNGFTTNPRYDSLLAKLIVTGKGADLTPVAARARRALQEFDIAGVDTNIPLLQSITGNPQFLSGNVDTLFLEDHIGELLASEQPVPLIAAATRPDVTTSTSALDLAPGQEAVTAPMAGVVVAVQTSPGKAVRAATPVVIIEAMKMEHVVTATIAGTTDRVLIEVGQSVQGGQTLVVLDAADTAETGETNDAAVDLDAIRPDLAEVLDRKDRTTDARRPASVERRHQQGHRTARENISDLCEPGTFVEYGGLTLAAQRQRRSVEYLIDNTPADGLVGGLGVIDGHRAVVMSYDYMVMAGTQGVHNHDKMRRLFDIARQQILPVVMLLEGGGGRPGDTDFSGIARLDEATFSGLAQLSGKVPTIAVVSGRCFAGNAALASISDVIIATEDVSIGMGGPAMIEGGGLGVFTPEEVGPADVQVPNGVIDVLVKDEAEAIATAKTYLRFFTDRLQSDYETGDQRLLRHIVPENRLRAYNIRHVTDLVTDSGSVLEIRAEYGVGILTALGRVAGRAVGIIANNPAHLGGAIDAPAAEKAARFLQLCDAHRLPVLSLVDTPGFMVGPESEKTATVRRFGRLFVVGANLRVPVVAVVLRKGYGLGAMAMTGGDLKAPLATLAWPSGEFGGMGLEGAVRLGYKAELAAIENQQERDARFAELVDDLYTRGKALTIASVHEVDDVIDPTDTRAIVASLFETAAPALDRFGENGRGYIDTW